MTAQQVGLMLTDPDVNRMVKDAVRELALANFGEHSGYLGMWLLTNRPEDLETSAGLLLSSLHAVTDGMETTSES